MTKFLNISVDDTLGGASPSDETVSSQKALKTYIDNRVEPLPSQSGQSGKFLTTNGTSVSWASVPSDSSKANTYLSNLTSVGKNIGNWSTNITNCVVEIPQDIKLELSSGTLTLKAGSKCYVKGDTTTPTYTIPSDKTATQTTNGSYFAFYDGTNLVLYLKTTYNYTTLPSTTSLPLAEITVSGGEISSIDQVFNGIGYIGSHVFFLPGYSVLTPNGRNADGTLTNIKYTFTSCSTFTRSLTGTSIPLLVRNNGTIGMSTGVSYDPITNQSVPVGWAQVGTIDLSSGVISNFNIKMVFRSVDYSEFMNTVGDIETLLAQV